MAIMKNLLFRGKWVAITAATILLALLLAVLSPVFLSVSNIQGVLIQASVTGIMAMGMTFIILTSGIDISVGAILYFTAALFAKLVEISTPIPLAFGAAILCASLLGTLNGFLVVTFSMSPLITTLATYTMYRGMAIHLTSAQNIPVPRAFGFLGNGKIYGIPVPILLFALIFFIGLYLLGKTRFGIYVMALGNSVEAARESNLPVKKITMGAYFLGGITTSISALILLARVGGLQSGMGIGIEFTVIAAVVLGGTKLSGGSGTIIGSAVGAIFLVLIDNGLNLIQASPYIYDIVKGTVLLTAVIVDKVSIERQKKQLHLQKALRIQGVGLEV
ncbi:ABC transporter permease [Vallitalea pronyensis]|uniref:ABC transporter permease n=1 Tax=Vallitalea pronyensis TaxID=1348613 RepID=A0A8J8SJD3_9FIRM|nr:ABC transporter permease [Vallitalea pronyensis]QUI25438.1 ABC transporter permease [Vallitalea pronyensis]